MAEPHLCFDACQWKALMDLLCNCEAALTERLEFYLNFTNIVDAHLRELPEDFFHDMHTKGTFIQNGGSHVVSCHLWSFKLKVVDVCLSWDLHGVFFYRMCRKLPRDRSRPLL